MVRRPQPHESCYERTKLNQEDKVQNVTGSRAERPIERVIETLRRRFGLILLCSLGVALAAFGFSVIQQKEYTATASLLFRDPAFGQTVFGSGAETFFASDPDRQAATNVALASLHTISRRTAITLDDGTTPDDIDSAIEVSAEGPSDVVSISATDDNPERAQTVANTFAQSFIQFRASADQDVLLEAKRLAEKEFSQLSDEDKTGPRGAQLSRGAEKLGMMASLQTGNAELVQPAELPTAPSSPKIARNTVLGLIVGIIFGIFVAFLLERVDRRIRRPEEAEEAYGVPLLATIPESKHIADSNDGSELSPLPFQEAESFRSVRASLRYFGVDRDVRTVLVTSAAPQEGKSTLAWNLARVASLGSKVVLVETDMRRPSLSRQHGISPTPGLSEVLTNQTTVGGALQSTPAPESSEAGQTTGSLDVLTGGTPPPNPAELLESSALREIVAELRAEYDLVVIDTAPAGVVTDAIPLAKMVDGVLLVVRIDQSNKDSAHRLRENLDMVGANTLGVVANRKRHGRFSKYGYGDQYRYATRYESTSPR